MMLAAALSDWGWFILGVVLMIAEVLAPGAFMLWLGLAAFAVGVLSFVVDWGWQAQCIAFAIFSLAAIPLWRRVGRSVEPPSTSPFLNRRTAALVGRVFTLETAITDGPGTVRIDDTVWRVDGPAMPAGSRVRIVKADGAALTVGPE